MTTLGCLSLDPKWETDGGWQFKGFPSKRLPDPVKGLNLGSVSAGASSATGIKDVIHLAEEINIYKSCIISNWPCITM